MDVDLIANRIWKAGVDAVRAETLVSEHVCCDGRLLRLAGVNFELDAVERICVVGAGKASGFLAAALEGRLEPVADRVELSGWVNVPADCVVPTRRITLHAGRAAGVNEPAAEGVEGTKKILAHVSSLGPRDLCVCLLTGGGSALLPAPRTGVTLADKLAVTRLLSSRGANIRDLNRVRIALSEIKGGGLLRACAANQLISLIISDVIGDPLDLIASGPTVLPEDTDQTPAEILGQFVSRNEVDARVWRVLEAERKAEPLRESLQFENRMLANNASAVAAAANEARALGFAVETVPPEAANTRAEEVGEQLLRHAQSCPPRTCVLWGGEPVVELAPVGVRGKGGRNQQAVLAALSNWHELDDSTRPEICILSGGTDGEDGPTDAAGAFIHDRIAVSVAEHGFDVAKHLTSNDAWNLFEPVGGLIRTGPTHTNVCDLRVVVRR